jgi:hypothetical protein
MLFIIKTKVLLTQPYETFNNVFIIKTKVLLTQLYVTLAVSNLSRM